METVTFTNSMGQSVKFADAPFFIQNIDGLGDLTANIQSQKSPYQDGSTYLDAIFDEREITVEFLIVADRESRTSYGDISLMREYVATIVNAKLGPGVLTYENERVTRLITCIANSVPLFPDNGDRTLDLQKASITFIAKKPYWRSTKINEEPTFKPLFQFPFMGAFQLGKQQEKRFINNDGNAPMPIQVEFYGPALNPKISNNTTGEFIKINQFLLDGECMLLDTSDDNKSILFINKSGEVRNVYHWIDLESKIFKLALGINEIEYTADSDIQGTIVNISYSKLYNAV